MIKNRPCIPRAALSFPKMVLTLSMRDLIPNMPALDMLLKKSMLDLPAALLFN
jgi:hypothetical protein